MGKSLGICTVCNEQEAKYKCSKCDAVYCSLSCFKDTERHLTKHEVTKVNDSSIITTEQDSEKQKDNTDPSIIKDPKYSKLINDERIQYLLSFKALRFHLFEIYKVLTTNPNLNSDQKFELANEKLTKLRQYGEEENEIVEEFCVLVSSLLKET